MERVDVFLPPTNEEHPSLEVDRRWIAEITKDSRSEDYHWCYLLVKIRARAGNEFFDHPIEQEDIATEYHGPDYCSKERKDFFCRNTRNLIKRLVETSTFEMVQVRGGTYQGQPTRWFAVRGPVVKTTTDNDARQMWERMRVMTPRVQIQLRDDGRIEYRINNNPSAGWDN